MRMIEGKCHCGAVHWTFAGVPEFANSCNCTVCRRYAVLWAYGRQDRNITVTGPTKAYVWGKRSIAFHFCGTCGCVAYWRALELECDGTREIAVNLRLAEPETVAGIPLNRFDGLKEWKSAPRDGTAVSHMWS
jgi:hypothetical protein